MILFCLPYAGGSKLIYTNWQKHLNPSIKFEPIELKGRGKRGDENFYESFNEAIDDLFLRIKEKITHNKYAIFGHSLGGLLTYELYYKICDEHLPQPKHLFFSGNVAPSVRELKELHKLPDNQFMKEIIDLGGTPEEVLKNEELRSLVLPILRSDIKLNENYVYKERKEKIACDVTVLNGKEEDISLEKLLEWKNHCVSFKIHMVEGNHFFINSDIENIMQIINFELNKHIRR